MSKFLKKIKFPLIFISSLSSLFILILIFLNWKTVVSGDSAIYFTFIRDFFKKPFMFGLEVQHGATGPLWVIINVLPLRLLGLNNWLIFASYLNFLFLLVSIVLISFEYNIYLFLKNVIFISLILTTSITLFRSSAELTEAPLAIFLTSLMLAFLKKENINLALLFSGLSILARPELCIVTFSLLFLYLNQNKKGPKDKRYFFPIIISLTPAFFTYLYLWISTGILIPSSIHGRLITSLENMSLNWWTKFTLSYFNQDFLLPISIPLLAFLTNIFLKKKDSLDKISNYQKATVQLTIPLIILWLIFPPLNYSQRYTLPLIFLLIPSALQINSFPFAKKSKVSYFIFSILPIIVLSILYFNFNRQLIHAKLSRVGSWSWILGEDFGTECNNLNSNKDVVMLTYEIQSQWATDCKLISLDGIVGGEMIPVLLNKMAFEDLIKKESINYITTMNSFKYRTIFKNTTMEKLYEHDLANPVNSKIKIGNLIFEKVVTNKCFSDINCFSTSDGYRQFGKSSPKELQNLHFVWNSIYKVGNF